MKIEDKSWTFTGVFQPGPGLKHVLNDLDRTRLRHEREVHRFYRPLRKARRRSLTPKRICWSRYLASPSLSAMLMEQKNPHTPMGKAVNAWGAAWPRTYQTILQRLEEPQR